MNALADRLRHHVSALALDIGERHVGRPHALAAAARYVESALTDVHRSVRRQSYEVHGIECANIETEYAGAEPDSAIVLVGAHYDTVPGSPGADDNASGVAAMIEMARFLSGRRMRCGVRFVAFVNEEPPFFYSGHMGSAVYARAARERGERIRVMLSLEMVGYYSNRRGTQHYPPLPAILLSGARQLHRFRIEPGIAPCSGSGPRCISGA